MKIHLAIGMTALAHFVAAADRSLTDGLVAYMPFDSTVTENAASGSSVSPRYRDPVAIAAEGMFGNYIDFPSDREHFVYLDGADSGSVAYESGKCFAATLWVKIPEGTPGDPSFLANKSWSGGGSGKGFVLFNTSSGVGLNAADGSSRIDLGTMYHEGTNDWTFYAVTCDADGVITLYQGRKDGTLASLSGQLPDFTMESGASFCVGNDVTGYYSYPFIGGIDDVGIWTRTLSQDEISRIYSAGRVGIALGTLANASAGPATAMWTGSISSDATVPGNWSGNELPTIDTDVTVSGAVSITLAEGATLPCKSILFDNVTLGADANLRGLDASKIASGSSVDLNGHALYLRAGRSLPLAVTDMSVNTDNPGELHIDDLGVDIANTTMALSGNMRFFKSGAGKFTSSASETYTGGFAVEGGTFFMTRNGSGVVSIGAGATLDAYGFDLKDCRHVTLAGGTITSTRDGAGVTLCASMDVTADSSIVMADLSGYHDITVPQYTWNLGGNTLALVMAGSDPDFYLTNGGTMSNGTFRVVVMTTDIYSGGRAWVHFANMNGRDGLSLDLGASILRMENTDGNSSVCDFTCNPRANEYVGSSRWLEVYGTFTPQSQDGFDLLMMDGSAIDLSHQSAPWSCHFTNALGENCNVSFASGATVTIKLAGRADLDTLADSGGYVALWSEDAVPDSSETFVLDDATASDFHLKRDNTGLKVRKNLGLRVILR